MTNLQATRLVLIRHAQCISNKHYKDNKVFIQQKHSDELTSNGIDMAKAIGKGLPYLLKRIPIVDKLIDYSLNPIIYTSESLRTQETWKHTGLSDKFIIQPWLNELSMSKMNNKERTDYAGSAIAPEIEKLCNENRGKTLILITHALVIKHYLNYITQSSVVHMAPALAGVTVLINMSNGQTSLETFSDMSALAIGGYDITKSHVWNPSHVYK
jgi:broad specificity phosphatase PhoE